MDLKIVPVFGRSVAPVRIHVASDIADETEMDAGLVMTGAATSFCVLTVERGQQYADILFLKPDEFNGGVQLCTVDADGRNPIYHWPTREEARRALMTWHKQEMLEIVDTFNARHES